MDTATCDSLCSGGSTPAIAVAPRSCARERPEKRGILQVKLQDVQSFYQEDGKSPFKHMPWKQGALHLVYESVRSLSVLVAAFR